MGAAQTPIGVATAFPLRSTNGSVNDSRKQARAESGRRHESRKASHSASPQAATPLSDWGVPGAVLFNSFWPPGSLDRSVLFVAGAEPPHHGVRTSEAPQSISPTAVPREGCEVFLLVGA